MGIKFIINTIGLVLIVVLLASRCDRDKSDIKGIPVTSYYDTCEATNISFGDRITIGDPNDRFMISLPYSWDIRESYTDSIYGMFAANFLSIPIEEKDRLALMVTGYQTDLTAEKYYIEEIKTLRKDEAIDLLETGVVNLADRHCHWLMFKNTGTTLVFHLVVYVKNDKSNEIYLIQSMSYDPDNYRNKLCYLKLLVSTFEIVD